MVAPKTAAESVWRREIQRWLPGTHTVVTLPEMRYKREYRLATIESVLLGERVVRPELGRVQPVQHRPGVQTGAGPGHRPRPGREPAPHRRHRVRRLVPTDGHRSRGTPVRSPPATVVPGPPPAPEDLSREGLVVMSAHPCGSGRPNGTARDAGSYPGAGGGAGFADGRARRA